MKYLHSTLFQQFKRAAQRAELQQRALAEDIERERRRGKWGTKPNGPVRPAAPVGAPVVIRRRRVFSKEVA